MRWWLGWNRCKEMIAHPFPPYPTLMINVIERR